MEPTIEVRDVALAYRLARSSASSIKEFAIHLFRRQVTFEEHWALRGLSFDVHHGEVLGVLGPNGAGKSTLLKVLARVLPPARGRVIVRGHVAPLIELGAGFNHELTALENIVLYGTLLGRDPTTMRRRAPEIAAWADLTDYLTVPVRSFSSGMLARLAFSIAVDEAPEVLLLDEVLSVGDAAFRERSGERMRQLIAGGSAVVLVSHDMKQLVEHATRAIHLDSGEIKHAGEPADVVAAYLGRLP